MDSFAYSAMLADGGLADGDVFVSFNYRADRAREMFECGGGGQGKAAAQSGSDAGASGSGGHGSPRGSSAGQTRDVSARLIKGMPLYDGARQGLDVTLIDTPGDGDLL